MFSASVYLAVDYRTMTDRSHENLAAPAGPPDRQITRLRGRYKRPLDLTVLIVSHVFLLPVWALLWMLTPLAIWLEDRGPIFYVQERVGRGGRTFWLFKFRSMRMRADNAPWPELTGINDPRITRVGRILRRTALDELPQVLSIWKGDMSLVGPRAEPTEHHQQLVQQIPEWSWRLTVRPGLTGLAQVCGTNNWPPSEKIRYDLEYIQRMSPILDIKLLALSVLNTLRGRWDRRT